VRNRAGLLQLGIDGVQARDLIDRCLLESARLRHEIGVCVRKASNVHRSAARLPFHEQLCLARIPVGNVLDYLDALGDNQGLVHQLAQKLPVIATPGTHDQLRRSSDCGPNTARQDGGRGGAGRQ